MITVKDVLRYQLYKCSTEIYRIKENNYRDVIEEKTVFENGEYKKVKINKCVNHINPKCPEWKKYFGLKKEVTRLLETLYLYNSYNLTIIKELYAAYYYMKISKIQEDINQNKPYLKNVEDSLKKRQEEIQYRKYLKSTFKTEPMTEVQ